MHVTFIGTRYYLLRLILVFEMSRVRNVMLKERDILELFIEVTKHYGTDEEISSTDKDKVRVNSNTAIL